MHGKWLASLLPLMAALAPSFGATAAGPVVGYFDEVEGGVEITIDGQRVRDAAAGQGLAVGETVRVLPGGSALLFVPGRGRIEIRPGRTWPTGNVTPAPSAGLFDFTKPLLEAGTLRGPSVSAAWGLPAWTVLATPQLQLDWRHLAGGADTAGEAMLYGADGTVLGRAGGRGRVSLPEGAELTPGGPYFWDLRLRDGRVFHGAFLYPTAEDLRAIQAQYDDPTPIHSDDPRRVQDYRAAVLIHHQLYLEAGALLGARALRDPGDRIADEWLRRVSALASDLPPRILAGIVDNLARLADPPKPAPLLALSVAAGEPADVERVAAEGDRTVTVQPGARIAYTVTNLAGQPLSVFVFHSTPPGAGRLHGSFGDTGCLMPGRTLSGTLAPACIAGQAESLVVVAQPAALGAPSPLASLLAPPAYDGPPSAQPDDPESLTALLFAARFANRYDRLSDEDRTRFSSIDAYRIALRCRR